jgi:hypothetical protein
VDRAKEKLTPEILEIIKDEATRREDNLPVIYHYSKNRVGHIFERVRDAREQAAKATTGNVGAADTEVGRGSQEGLAGAEGRNAPEPVRPAGRKTLKPFRPPQNTYRFMISGREGRGFEEMPAS